MISVKANSYQFVVTLHFGGVDMATIGAKPGDTVMCSYGFGYMATSARLVVR